MATPNKLTPAERKLISQALVYYHKGTLRAITTAQDEQIKNIHTAKGYEIQALNNRLTTSELDL